MKPGKHQHPRHTDASALHDDWAAGREAERLRLVHEIEAAFDGVALGNGVSLHQARAMDDDWVNQSDVADLRSHDPEERWQDISDEKLDLLADTLPFMDAEGFRFYLPRFMVFALKHSEGSQYSSSWACDTAIYWTDLRDTTGKHALLTQAQREAVRAFGEYFRDER